ncbi:hypothetical protein M885DRAFT_542118 [Pelagophyceae sp. CCMP2097]|nr:hypothetical protein M885DRAFT_542118 [Pelagophyceae sp. CCMP2097]
MDASLNATVDVPLNRPGGASKALQATSLYQCLLYRVIVTFARWHVVRKADLDDVDESEHIPEAAAHVPKDATAEDIAPQEYEMPPMLTLEGETPNERVVMACTATKGFDVLKQWHPSYAFECLAGYSLVEETFNLAESADVKETDNTVVGITVDPDPEADRWTLLSSGDDLPHLEFFARCAKVEAALHSWCSLVHTMEQGDDISKGHIADDGSTHTLSIAVQVLARHPRYWTLKIGGDDVSSKGYLFLFTAPDLALGHYLEARASNPHIPQMVPAQLSTGGVRKLLRVNEAMAGIWFNPRVDPRVSMETKIDRFALLNLIRVVDLYGYSVLPGW